MTRGAHGERHVVFVLDADDLVVAGEGEGTAGHQVPVRVSGVDALDEQVLEIAVGVGHAPGDAPVVTEDHEGYTGRGRAGDLPLRGNDAYQVPEDRHVEAEMGIVGEDGLAGRGALSRDHPDVGGAARCRGRHRVVEFEEAGRGGGDRYRVGPRVGRPQLGDLARTEAFGKPGTKRFAVALAAEAGLHDACPDQAVSGPPRLGGEAKRDELGWQHAAAIRQPSVDAVGVRLDQIPCRRPQCPSGKFMSKRSIVLSSAARAL